jgi:NAD(P)-dependent dehydrogenase (short-subunit alcohol dehydrogenase family)
MTDIKGRAAVVTGGGSGIGAGLAKELAKQGASVAVADIKIENAQKVAADINAAGGKAVALHVDVCDRGSIKKMAAEAKAALGTITLVFANAGATSFDALMDMSDDDVEWILTVNLLGVMFTTRAFLPDMIAEGNGGHICATASMAGLLPGWIPVHVPYSAAKMGIIGMMMNLQCELTEHNIHTTSYCPGGVATGMKKNNASYRPDKFGGPSSDEVHVDEEVSFKGNMPTFYTPADIAPMVLNAVTNNRAFAFDHAEHRGEFRRTYSNIVEGCYDDIQAWEEKHGTPTPNPTGPVLQQIN